MSLVVHFAASLGGFFDCKNHSKQDLDIVKKI